MVLNTIKLTCSFAGDLVQNLLHGPIEVTIGIVTGIGWGVIAACFPHRTEVSVNSIPLYYHTIQHSEMFFILLLLHLIPINHTFKANFKNIIQ